MAGRVAYSQLDGTDLHWSIDLNQLGAFDREDRDNVPWVKCLGEHVSLCTIQGPTSGSRRIVGKRVLLSIQQSNLEHRTAEKCVGLHDLFLLNGKEIG